VTKSEWIAIAKVLGTQRSAIEGAFNAFRKKADRPAPTDVISPTAVHDQKLIFLAELAAIDKVAVLMAATLDHLCPTFDRRYFFRLVGSDGG
jgi:hypothetical protein